MTRIFFVGYMGSGKSTIGRRVAARLNHDFIDLDKYIEERHFKTVSRIFEDEGETGFRTFERNALLEISEFENIVISTGGGAPCFFDNMEQMNRKGITIYLAPDVDTLATRLMKSKTVRPLIQGKTGEELTAFIETMLSKREPFYNQSKIIIRGEKDLSAEHVVELIREYMRSEESK